MSPAPGLYGGRRQAGPGASLVRLLAPPSVAFLLALLLGAVGCGPSAPEGSARPSEGGTGEPGGPPAEGPAEPLGSLGLRPEVSAVASGGWWSSGSTEGIYRVVLVDQGFEHVVTKAYLQWIETSSVGGAQTVLETAPLDQLNETPLFKLEIARLRPTTEGIEIELT